MSLIIKIERCDVNHPNKIPPTFVRSRGPLVQFGLKAISHKLQWVESSTATQSPTTDEDTSCSSKLYRSHSNSSQKITICGSGIVFAERKPPERQHIPALVKFLPDGLPGKNSTKTSITSHHLSSFSAVEQEKTYPTLGTTAPRTDNQLPLLDFEDPEVVLGHFLIYENQLFLHSRNEKFQCSLPQTKESLAPINQHEAAEADETQTLIDSSPSEEWRVVEANEVVRLPHGTSLLVHGYRLTPFLLSEQATIAAMLSSERTGLSESLLLCSGTEVKYSQVKVHVGAVTYEYPLIHDLPIAVSLGNNPRGDHLYVALSSLGAAAVVIRAAGDAVEVVARPGITLKLDDTPPALLIRRNGSFSFQIEPAGVTVSIMNERKESFL